MEEKEELRQQRSRLRSTIKTLRVEYTAALDAIERLQGQHNSNLAVARTTLNSQHDSAIEALKQEHASALETLKQDQASHIRRVRKQYDFTLQFLNDRCNRLTTEQSGYKGVVFKRSDILKVQNSNLKTQLETAQSSIKEKDQMMEQKKEAIEKMKEKKDELASSVSKLEASNKFLVISCFKLTVANRKLRNEADLAAGQLESTTAEMQKFKEKAAILEVCEKSCSGLADANRRIRDESEKLAEEMKALKSEAQEFDNKAKRLDDGMVVLNQQCNDYATLLKKLHCMEKETVVLKSKLVEEHEKNLARQPGRPPKRRTPSDTPEEDYITHWKQLIDVQCAQFYQLVPAGVSRCSDLKEALRCVTACFGASSQAQDNFFDYTTLELKDSDNWICLRDLLIQGPPAEPDIGDTGQCLACHGNGRVYCVQIKGQGFDTVCRISYDQKKKVPKSPKRYNPWSKSS